MERQDDKKGKRKRIDILLPDTLPRPLTEGNQVTLKSFTAFEIHPSLRDEVVGIGEVGFVVVH
jgi:hypothetical protein